VESRRDEDARLAAEVLALTASRRVAAIRLGVSGPPGAGKSCLIDNLGCRLGDEGRRVAVLAVDPSSSLSGGSILGDKTRMDGLASRPDAFIRPSPAAGTLGGVARRTRESLLLCEAAGYDVVIVETVGVGQSEIQVRQLVDVLLLLLLPGSGDELQGIKRGIMELADLVAVNKADGGNLDRARGTRAEFAGAVQLLPRRTPEWKTPVLLCSALTGEGLPELWREVLDFREHLLQRDLLDYRRSEQELFWMDQLLEERLLERFHRHPAVAARRKEIRGEVRAGRLSADAAAALLLKEFS